MKTLLLSFFVLSLNAFAYPEHWWKPVPREGAPSWEVLPQDANPGEVILSKRNELGILSNFAATAFTYRGVRYNSVEGFWQMMKYPESASDPRAQISFPFTRETVAQMTAFEAKDAGSVAEKLMLENGIDWVSFEGQQFTYCSVIPGEHYRIIKEAMWEKLQQNPTVREILKSTGDLKLRPDHFGEGCEAPEWKYYEIWMEFRGLI